MERPLRAAGIDPNRAYTPKEIRALKAEGRANEAGAPVIKKLHKPGRLKR